jgi:hypothetical protein
MRFWSWHRRAHNCWQRRLVVVVALAGYLVATIGVPLPAYVNKDHGTPFPCQHHACGCATARQCWESCCCYSPQEKLAWATANHVEPPTRLIAEVEAAAAHPSHDCDAHAPKPAGRCCSAAKAAVAVAAHHEHGDQEESGCEHCGQQAPQVTLVIGALARQCRGLADLWIASGAALPPPATIDWQFQWTLVERVAPDERPVPQGDLAPPVPPPRV